MRRPRHGGIAQGLGAVLALTVLTLGAGCSGGSAPTESPEPSAPGTSAPATSAAPTSPSSPPEEEPQVLDMALEEGAAIQVAGMDAYDDIIPTNPVQVSFSRMRCVKELPDIATDPDGRVRDLRAKKDQQVCLVELAVKNAGGQPIKWTAEETASIIGDNREEYLISNSRWSAGAAADKAGKRYAGDGNLIPPGGTEFDYVVFDIPEDVQPVELRFLA